MNLYLVRHSEAVSTQIDSEQPLSEQGRKETEKVATLLLPKKLEIDEIIHSVKLRAKQTAEILGRSVAPNVTLIEKEGLKPMDPIEPILEEIALYDRNVMLVGHLPFMERVVTELLGSCPITFCGSCVAALQGEKHNWKLAWTVTPNDG